MDKKVCGIYKITNRINKHLYIGQSRDIYNRWRQHKANFESRSRDTMLYQAMRKYGIENFEFEIVEECNPQLLDEREIYYIQKYNSYGFNKPKFGYNMTKGGDGQNGWGKKVCQYDLNGFYIKTFDSMTQAEETLGFSKGSITNCCYHRRKSLGGYMWCFEGETPPKAYIDNRVKKVCQYDLNGNFIHMFNSISEASQALKCNKTQISECCRTKNKSCFGYQWRFENDIPPQKKKYKTKKTMSILQLSPSGSLIQSMNQHQKLQEY